MNNPSRKIFIRQLYDTLLKREPLLSEIQYWLEMFDAGCSEHEVRAEFMKSSEFVLALSQCLRRRLGRPPVTKELTSWQEKLSNSMVISELDCALKNAA